MLTNEKYIGDSLFQKSYTPETLPLARVKNDGQLTQYYIKILYPAIIDREKFEQGAAAHNSEKRINMEPRQKFKKFPLSGILKCGLKDQHSNGIKIKGKPMVLLSA